MSAITKQLPSIEYLKECFEIDRDSPNGLKWKDRPLNHFASKMNWVKFKNCFAGRKCGLIRNNYYSTKMGQRNIYNHRIIYAIYNNVYVDSSLVIDHIDRNKLNNNPENLRVVSRSENAINSGLSSKNTSGVKGVTWDKRANKWTSRIKLNNKVICLGSFIEKNDAINARILAEKTFYKL